ncbi:hypothetical protein [Mycolicibacterium sediminis]|uniref:Uncharacterized protein n=1 Tax=Mycolicibacterium sediminis TaxID=1286180 RepID=A0A7I7QRX7_9MYCO|nr:hypothetical protein [Mycolicibacterium sediminis]BBY28566.1 hypothetical protein MSEDJ_26620 [Mycolicibacterium sediminis]
MTADANVTEGPTQVETPDEQPDTSTAGKQAPETAAAAAPGRSWSMPKAPVDRKQVDDFGRKIGGGLITVGTSIARAVAGLLRFGARTVARAWRAIEGVPAAVRTLAVAAGLVLVGVAGSVALAGAPGLICAIVVVPTCSVVLGALGHRWLSGHGLAASSATAPQTTARETADLERSVTYVDKKLTVALNSLGSDRHQQAVIALFQAKTAVELALGTEQDAETRDDAPVHVDAHRLRPRIQPGPNSSLSQHGSLAAS